MRIYTLLILLFVSFSLSAQVDNIIDENDPYSIFGLGEPREVLSAKSRAMGGVGIAFNHHNRINLLNPASLAWIGKTTFQAGIFVKNNWISDETAASSDLGSAQSGNVSMAYISLGFPIWKKYIGSAFSLQPYSRISYNLIDQFQNIGSIDSTEYRYTGVGDIYALSWSNGFKYKSFAGGIGAHYYFGNYNKSTISFTDEPNFFGIRKSDNVDVGGLAFDAGLLFSHLFESKELDEDEKPNKDKNILLNIGARYKLGADINANRDIYYERIQETGTGIVVPYDTIQSIVANDGKITLPSEIGLGVLIRRGAGLEIGADYSLYNGSEYRFYGAEDSLQNASKIAVGLALTPQTRGSLKQYWKIVNYRFGAYYYTNHLRLFGEDIPEYGISFGLGVPIPQSRRNQALGERTVVDLSMVFGQRGQALSPLLKEDFFRVTLGFNMNASWFRKPQIE